MDRIEQAFYSNKGHHLGEPSVRVRVASQLEVLMTELWVSQEVFTRASPLIDALRRRTITRRRYEQLVATLTQNMLVTGQPDETALVLRTVERMWRRCPAYYLPDWRRVWSRLRPKSSRSTP